MNINISHNYNNKTLGFSKEEPETVLQNSFKDKTINDCKHATPLYKADLFKATLDTLSMDTKQSVNFLGVSFLQDWMRFWPRLCRNVYDYSMRKRLFSYIPLSSQVKWLILHVDMKPDAFPFNGCSEGNTSFWSVRSEVVFSQNQNWSQKVDLLCRGSPTGWHHSPLNASNELNFQIYTPNDSLLKWQRI